MLVVFFSLSYSKYDGIKFISFFCSLSC